MQITKMKMRVFVVEYIVDSRLYRHEESLSCQMAFALGRQLALRGLRPRVRRFDMTAEEVDIFLERFAIMDRRRRSG